MGIQEVAKKTGYSQIEAGKKLGLHRAAVQNWENEIRPVPLAVELACHELWRHWKQRPEFGPVTLLYADDPIWQRASPPGGVLLLQRERHSNNESAIRRAVWLWKTVTLFNPLIIEDDGNVVWSSPELLRECDPNKRRVKVTRDRANVPLLNQLALTVQRPLDPKATGYDFGFKFQAMYGSDARYTHFLGEFDESISDRNQFDIVEAHALLHLPWLTPGGIDLVARPFEPEILFRTLLVLPPERTRSRLVDEFIQGRGRPPR